MPFRPLHCTCRLPVLFVDVNAVPSAVVYGAGIKVRGLSDPQYSAVSCVRLMPRAPGFLLILVPVGTFVGKSRIATAYFDFVARLLTSVAPCHRRKCRPSSCTRAERRSRSI